MQKIRRGQAGGEQAIVQDLDTDTAEIVSVTPAGDFDDGGIRQPVFSDDGRFVLFLSRAENLSTDDDSYSAYVNDLVTGEVILASRNSNGETIDDIVRSASISASGRYVAFTTDGRNADAPRAGGYQVFLFDRTTGQSELLSQAFDGGRVRNQSWLLPESFARNGRMVFEGRDRNYVVDDLNGDLGDIHLSARLAP